MATIKDIAQKCNVSIATVSNILNEKGSPSEATKQRVLEAAKELNYVPNFLAKNLKSGSKKMIGVIAEDLTVFSCPEIIDGIHEYVDQQGYTYLLGNLRLYKKYGNDLYQSDFRDYYQAVEKEFLIMSAKNVEGIIYVGAHCREILAIKEKYNIPVVVAYGYTRNSAIPSILFDDETGAYEVSKILVANKPEKVGVIAGLEHSIHTLSRLKGFQQALFESGILYNPNFVRYANWEREASKAIVGDLLDEGITALFAMNDEMAMGVYDYAYENGIDIGKDLYLVGFDNNETADVVKPGLSTVELPLHKMGLKAADLLIDMIENKRTPKESEYKIPCKVVQR